MPVISLRFIIIGIITDTTGITIIIVVITTSDLALPTRGSLRGEFARIMQFGQLKFVEKTMQRFGLTLTAAIALIAGGDGGRPPPGGSDWPS